MINHLFINNFRGKLDTSVLLEKNDLLCKKTGACENRRANRRDNDVATYGMGISIWTPLSSRLLFCNSYSTFTSHPSPPSLGQQLTKNRTRYSTTCQCITSITSSKITSINWTHDFELTRSVIYAQIISQFTS